MKKLMVMLIFLATTLLGQKTILKNVVDFDHATYYDTVSGKWEPLKSDQQLLIPKITGQPKLINQDCNTGKIYKVSPEIFDHKEMQKAICKKYGHRWVNTTKNTIYATYPPQYPPQQRKCSVCGLEQTLKTTPKIEKWETNE